MNKWLEEPGLCKLDNYKVFKLQGLDSLQFLQGQTTADLKLVPNNCFTINTRLTRTGQIEASFYTAIFDGCFYIIIHQNISQYLISELEKFIIMEDVEIEEIDTLVSFSLNPIDFKNSDTSYFRGLIFGVEGYIFWNQEVDQDNTYFELNEVKELFSLNGYHDIEKVDYSDKKLINETIFNDTAISYSKGCFLGSETVSKINNGRGGAYFPVMLISHKNISNINLSNKDIFINKSKVGTVISIVQLETETIFLVNLFRQFRVENLEMDIELDDVSYGCTMKSHPYGILNTFNERSIYFYDKGTALFVSGEESEAILNLELALTYNPKNIDACETLGVIFGRQGHFEKGISLMDRLLEADPTSVMAHTNKSLYLMNLGRIDEAEDEKSKATVKTFEKFGTEAELKEKEEEARKVEAQNTLRRKDMFLQVLDIDSEDMIANFGLAHIEYDNLNFAESLKYLDNITESNRDTPEGLMLLGMNYEGLGDIKKSKDYYNTGIGLASSKGEMKLAGTIQQRLKALS